MVERLGEDEDDGRQGDGDVACCGDDELFLQAASVGHKTTKYFGCLRQEYIGRREIEDRSCTSLVEVQRRLVGGYDCLLTVDDDSSKNTTKRSSHHQYASML